MNISLHDHNALNPYFFEQPGSVNTEPPGGDPSGELTAPGQEMQKPGGNVGGLTKDGPGEELDKGMDHKFGGSALGNGQLPEMDLGAGQLLEQLSSAFGTDWMGQAEGMGKGERGAGSITPDAQDQFNGSVAGSGGSREDGTIASWAAAGSVAGLGFGCILGGVPGCSAGATLGGVIGGVIGVAVELTSGGDDSGAEKSGGSESGGGRACTESSAPEQAAPCDPNTQTCNEPKGPSTKGGMGDNQEESGMGDPVLASIALQRRAKQGDGAAAAVIAGRKGDLIPEWAVQPDSEDTGDGKKSDAALQRVAKHGDSFEGQSYYEPSGQLPPHEFFDAIEARAANPVINPLPA